MRVTRFMKNGNGGQNLGLRVLGVEILISANAENQERADQLAQLIGEIGPEDIAPPPSTVPASERPRDPAPARKRVFAVGERVWCNVHGAEGWSTVTEVGAGRRQGYIKISGERMWCPVHNFDREETHIPSSRRNIRR